MQLSKDRNLEEREQLQLQLSDVNYKMQQQQETIQVTSQHLFLKINYFQKFYIYIDSKNNTNYARLRF